TIARFIGYVGIAVGLTKLVRDMSTAWPGQREFTLYLYITYFTTVFGLAALVVVARHTLHRLYEANDLRAIAVKVEHRLAEVVRRDTSAVVNKTAPKLLKDDVALHGVF